MQSLNVNVPYLYCYSRLQAKGARSVWMLDGLVFKFLFLLLSFTVCLFFTRPSFVERDLYSLDNSNQILTAQSDGGGNYHSQGAKTK